MTLRQLQIFAEVAACGKMSTAASNLYVSQPTVSETIAEIERYYEVKLFERYPKRLYLTAAGEVFLDETLKILEDYIHLDTVMQEHLGGLPIRIGATIMAGHAVVIPALKLCMEENPAFKPEIQVRANHVIRSMLLENECDIAITQGIIAEDGLKKLRILENRLVLVCSSNHPFADGRKVTPDQISKQPFFTNGEKSDSRLAILNYLRSQGCTLTEAGTMENMSLIREAVLAGLGIAVLPSTLIGEDVEQGTLYMVPGYSWQRDFYLYYQQYKTLSENMKMFINACQSFASHQV